MNKRGQFFLVAAIIIVGVVIGLSSVVNSVNVNAKQEAFYDRSEEIGQETNRVLDYGVFNLGGNLNSLIEGYLEKNVGYISSEQVVFLYGDENGVVNAYAFEQGSVGNVGILTGSSSLTVEVQENVGVTANVIKNGNLVIVNLEGVNYEFDLRDGKNFFFVIVKSIDEERYVAQKS